MRGNVKRVRLDDTLLSPGLHCNSNHRHFYAVSLREIDGFRVPRIHVPRDTQPGIVGQYAFDAFRHLFRSVRDGDLSGMLRITDAHAAAIVNQSAMASDPSSIDSVSRNGDATDPQSR